MIFSLFASSLAATRHRCLGWRLAGTRATDLEVALKGCLQERCAAQKTTNRTQFISAVGQPYPAAGRTDPSSSRASCRAGWAKCVQIRPNLRLQVKDGTWNESFTLPIPQGATTCIITLYSKGKLTTATIGEVLHFQLATAWVTLVIHNFWISNLVFTSCSFNAVPWDWYSNWKGWSREKGSRNVYTVEIVTNIVWFVFWWIWS